MGEHFKHLLLIASKSIQSAIIETHKLVVEFNLKPAAQSMHLLALTFLQLGKADKSMVVHEVELFGSEVPI